jgi:hypothetical protein
MAIGLGLVVLGLTSPGAAETPEQLTHQGRLLDDSGQPITTDTQVTFTLYDSETGGAVIWETAQMVEPNDKGFYTVRLGNEQTPIDARTLESGDVWLQVTVEGNTLEPRLQLRATPYAIRAQRAESVEDGSIESSSLASSFEVDSDQIGNVSWNDVTGVPQELADGDDDTLGGISCQQGQIAEYDGSNWTCVTPSDSVAWQNVQNRPSGLDDGDDDTLGGVNCQQGQVPIYDGSSWSCRTPDQTTEWQNVTNRPSGLDDGDDDTVGGLNCGTGEVPQYDGSSWVCQPAYTDADARQAVANQDAYLKNSGDDLESGTIGNVPRPSQSDEIASKNYVDKASENRNLNGNAIENVDWKNSDRPLAWAAIRLDQGTYFSSAGEKETGLTKPSSGDVSCTANNKACVHNVRGDFFQVGLKIPDDAAQIGWGGGTNAMCWPVPLGDSDPSRSGNDEWDSGIVKHGQDRGSPASEGMGHCLTGNAPKTPNYNVSCIITAGTKARSSTGYGIVCMK